MGVTGRERETERHASKLENNAQHGNTDRRENTAQPEPELETEMCWSIFDFVNACATVFVCNGVKSITCESALKLRQNVNH